MFQQNIKHSKNFVIENKPDCESCSKIHSDIVYKLKTYLLPGAASICVWNTSNVLCFGKCKTLELN